MKKIDFIKNWIKVNREVLGIEAAFYEYYSYSETHFLKLSPENISDADENQILLSDLIISFEDAFPGEMLCVIGETSLTKLDNPVNLIEPFVISIFPILNFDLGLENVVMNSDFLTQYTFTSGNFLNQIITPSQFNTYASSLFKPTPNFSYTNFVFEDLLKAAEPELNYGKNKEEEYYLLAA